MQIRKGDKQMAGKEETTTLIDTGDYITTAYGSLIYFKCTACGYEEILNVDNFCPHCGRRITLFDVE